MSAKNGKKILLLMDFTAKVPEDLEQTLKGEEWKHELKILKTLRALGYETKPIAIFDTLEPLLAAIREFKPDLVFNQCESYAGKRRHEPNVVGLLDLLGIPHTGPGAVSLQLCKDKGLTKQILMFHRIRVPRFVISEKSRPIQGLKHFDYPAFIKPLDLEASEGIAQVSFAETEKQALDRIRFLHQNFQTDVIIEEYIEGRELYVSVIGNEKLRVLPPRELFFSDVPEGTPKFATYQAKWNDDYRKRWGIRNGAVRSLPKEVEQRLPRLCKKIFRLFQIQGFARIDLRVRPNGEIVFIEANPNPSIHRDDDFALSAESAGISYESLLEQIVQLGLNARYG